MKAPGHPIWSLMNLVVVLGFVLLFSWLNASKFDETEIKMLTEVVLGFCGWELAKSRIRRNGDIKE